MQDLKVTLIQANLSWENPEQNRKNFDKIISEIKENTDLIVLPEMFSTGFTMNAVKCAEPESGDTVKWMQQKAAEKKCVITGSILIRERDEYFNRLYWMNPDGYFETYNKRHLFRMGKEHLTMSSGPERKIVELKGWKINLQICYDLRFPVWSKNHYRNQEYEYDALIYVANWPEVRRSAYQSLIPARAIENLAYVIWVNRVGNDGNSIFHTGDSMVVDPLGKIIGEIPAKEEGIITETLSADNLIKYREKYNFGLDWDRFEIMN